MRNQAILLLMLILSACAVPGMETRPTIPASPTSDAHTGKVPSVQTPTLEPGGHTGPPLQTPMPEQEIQPPGTVVDQTSTPTHVPPQICSPLQGIPLAQLAETIGNPFNPPGPGSDEPHQGVDFADISTDASGEYRITLEGRPVLAALGGTVAAVVRERDPYGNAVLIETPLERLPVEWAAALGIPDAPFPAMIPDYHTPLSCPRLTPETPGNPNTISIYLLYAHMQQQPELQPGDTVACGEQIGAIGSSGNSLNPHLHLEARYGPGAVRFAGMAHYDPAALPEEMHAYCTWRVSGVFPLLDPMQLLSLTN